MPFIVNNQSIQQVMAHKRSRTESQSAQSEKEDFGNLLEYSFDHEAIINNQKRLAFALRTCTNDKSIKDFDTLKYKGVSYAVGDYVEIHSTEMGTPYVARLKRIVKVPKFMEEFPFIEIEWCLNKNHLPEPILATYGLHISNAEIFPSSESTFCLFIDSIKCKCFVLTFEEYSQLETSYDYYYFSRAIFKESTSTLTPGPEDWKKACTCLMPVNPDLQYVQCGLCQNWFHDSCVGEIDMNVSYVCRQCKSE